jgi:putative spermidine/putrescine transport system substrate-binding protein
MRHDIQWLSVAALLSASTIAAAQGITAVNYGGATGAAQKAAWTEPYAKASGNPVQALEYTGDQAKVKAMVEAKKVTWDIVEVEAPDVGRGCQEGLYEKLDWNVIGQKADLLPGSVTPCGLGGYIWSTVLGYNADTVKGTPSGWSDFWDVKKYPGKRGMRKEARYNLEFALMADGVPAVEVYKVLATKAGVDRAFKKMDEIKPYIQWWEAGAQPPQFLVAGDVVMSTVYNGRIDAAQREGRTNLRISWSQSIYEMDYYVIPKGSPNKAAAEKFLAYMVSPDAQAAFSKQIAYGPVNREALKKLDKKTLDALPNSAQNGKEAISGNFQFWVDQGDALEQRFTAWAAK